MTPSLGAKTFEHLGRVVVGPADGYLLPAQSALVSMEDLSPAIRGLDQRGAGSRKRMLLSIRNYFYT